MVERLRDKPFALIGINSDGDRGVSGVLEEDEKVALAPLGSSLDEVVEKVRRGDAGVLEKARAAAPAAEAKIKKADLAALAAVLEKNRITWRQAADRSTYGPLARRWNVSSWPTIYVLDAKGVIRFKNVRGQDLEQAVLGLLHEIEKGEKR